MYQHLNSDHQPIDLPVGKVVCVGRNYHDHIKEMASVVTSQPMLFMKPSAAMVSLAPHFAIPTHLGECHNEIEVALLVKQAIGRGDSVALDKQIYGVGLGLDLTLRDVQKEAKQKGHPWERAKSFDGSCPLTPFCALDMTSANDFSFSLQINDELRQQGNTQDMIFGFTALIQSITQVFSLQPGDVILTGTPAGVGPLQPDDQLSCQLDGYLSANTRVVAWP